MTSLISLTDVVLASLELLAIVVVVGVAFIGLGGVKLVCTMVSLNLTGKKGNPVNHNFAQLTKKIEKLKKALKKSSKKGKKHLYEESNSNSE
jgi:hypothetical protein